VRNPPSRVKLANVSSQISDRIHVILVEPYEPGNIGAVARAMANMGVSRLRLVNPRNPHSPECQRMALKAYPLVENAEIFPSFDQAASDLKILFGTTSVRGRKVRAPIVEVREGLPALLSYTAGQPVGIAFGPERRGLSDDQLARCQHLMYIPSSEAFPTLNLAQSVMVVLYEIFRAQASPLLEIPDLASQEERERMFLHAEETLINIGFLSRSNPGHIMNSIRRFLGKADLSSRDIRIIRGILSQMDWYVRSGRELDPGKVKKP